MKGERVLLDAAHERQRDGESGECQLAPAKLGMPERRGERSTWTEEVETAKVGMRLETKSTR